MPNPSVAAPAKAPRKPTHNPSKEPSHEPSARLSLAAAPAALADGRGPAGHAVRWCRHGCQRGWQPADAGRLAQESWGSAAGAGLSAPGLAPAVADAAVARRHARRAEAGGARLALVAVCADVRPAIGGLGDAVGRRLPAGAVRPVASAGTAGRKRWALQPAARGACLARLHAVRDHPDAPGC